MQYRIHSVVNFYSSPCRGSLFITLFLLLQELHGSCQLEAGWTARNATYLDECLGGLEEVLPSIGLGTLLEPIYNCLIRNTILVIQNLRRVIQFQHMDSSRAEIIHEP